MKDTLILLLCALLVAALFGCGGGGAASGPVVPPDPDPVAASRTFVVKTVGSAAVLYGVEFELRLPAGVTLALDGSGQLARDVVKASAGAAGADLVASYDAASAPQTVTISLIKLPGGFPVGECVSVTALVPEGTAFAPEDVGIAGVKAYDNLDGVPQPAIAAVVAFP